MHKFLLLFVALFSSWPLAAEDLRLRERLRPDYYVSQFAGSIGLLSFGAGKQLRIRSMEAELLFGYAPEAVTGEDIFALALKVRENLPAVEFGGNRFTPYLGLGLNYYFGDRYKVKGKYPDDYYPYSQVHLMPHIGLKLRPLGNDAARGMFYLEAGILDTYLIHYYNNSNHFELSDVVSVSAGITIPM